MKALVIAPQPFFSPRGTPFSVYYRTLVSSEMGIELDLLTYGEGMDVDIPNVNIIRIPRFKILGDVKIGPSLLKLFLDVFIVLWTVFLLIRNRYDFVHAHEEAVFFSVFLKPLFRFKLIYDMHSSLPQQLTNFKYTTSKLIISTFKALEALCIQKSDAVITICPDLADYVNGVIEDKDKHLLIENSIFDTVKLKEQVASAVDLSGGVDGEPIDLPENKKLVVYAGTLEPYQGIDILIRSIKPVLSQYPDAYWVVVGGSPDQVTYFSELARTEGVSDHIVFTGRVPQSVAKKYCHLAAVQLSPRSSGTNTPLKIYEQLANGIPLVATKIYSHTQVLDDSVAFLVTPDPSGMAAGVIEALFNEDKAREIVQNAKALYEEKYSRSAYESKMKRVMELVKP